MIATQSPQTVFVGLSGGVDSSVAAVRLKDQGYRVVGVYMKNWARNLPGWQCPWREDYQDAKRVAVQLGIEFDMFDFQTSYREKVVNYMLDSYRAGFTPNPDIICNQEIKFKLFLETALERGADKIATGHYAGTVDNYPARQPETNRAAQDKAGQPQQAALYQARDSFKDQTYFLYRVQRRALAHTLFPLSHSLKNEVKAEARKRGLVTAGKKESMGICFVGKIGIRDFLAQYVEAEPGPIVDQYGREIGQHDGAIFYTIGQRQGLRLGAIAPPTAAAVALGGAKTTYKPLQRPAHHLPYYVVGKDMARNVVYVTNDINDRQLWSSQLRLGATHWINSPPQSQQTYRVRIRHQAPLVEATLTRGEHGSWQLQLAEEIRAAAPGQSAVVYEGARVVGGGIIAAAD